MTIAIGCNLADGVILGADSAITMQGTVQGPQRSQSAVVKVYNETEKLFPLYDLPIGIMTYGAAILRNRTIESHIREFQATKSQSEISTLSIEDVSRRVWSFLHQVYLSHFAEAGTDIMGVPAENRPGLGLLVGGFGRHQYLSELWEVVVQADNDSAGVVRKRGRGEFGSTWKGTTEGVRRFHKGFSFQHLDQIITAILEKHNLQMDSDLQRRIQEIVATAEYVIPFDGMPLQEGVDYVRFLLDVMINQTRFVVGAPTCGGRVRIAVVQNVGFQWVTDTPFILSH